MPRAVEGGQLFAGASAEAGADGAEATSTKRTMSPGYASSRTIYAGLQRPQLVFEKLALSWSCQARSIGCSFIFATYSSMLAGDHEKPSVAIAYTLKLSGKPDKQASDATTA
ncbi:hypothetical protein JG687_00007037 [Phytophthora cactorum]|uniref:Uncharacterized protein n=1 Tax=Phytophthora cactorum TaxID=29920 RepID=A0A329STU8_9STRA|nr:hypothetical protein PC112_g12257 [Phytophthora cactorum]KAG2821214.1 hypothetical protein PC111_g11129 [Phytophthora cactorum]KAG2855054.1 hypothetical protein PC113_g12766 [Phytophthora cactorum]KAG2932929.1 hypothetical protein PC117_g12995 [Phytophthora cactorum]KAG2978324.1 hypothetical protein PC118_g12358 [Phytophthora cactorum]